MFELFNVVLSKFLICHPILSVETNRDLPQKAFLGKISTCQPGKIKVKLNATKGVSSVCEPLPPDRPLWFPGSSPPEWLDGR